MSTALERMEACQDILEALNVPPPLVDGKVQYPEGEAEMGEDEYLALHGVCEHKQTVTVLAALAVTSYNANKGFMGTCGRRALAPVMVGLVHRLGLVEKWGHIRWDV